MSNRESTEKQEQKPEVMLGMTMPDISHWSPRVQVALGQNPSVFTGPGTNTYLVGTGKQRILLDPGQGTESYLPVLERAMEESGVEGIQEIVLTHGHPDHMGGVGQIVERFGAKRITKFPWPDVDGSCPAPLHLVEDDAVIETEGATLRGIHTPGHAPDHLCFWLEEESSLFSGDNVLGVGTTVIPAATGSLSQYMDSLERLRARGPKRIYPAHGPCIENAVTKIEEYIAHRLDRERQILAALETLRVRAGDEAQPHSAMEIVAIVYAAYPKELHAAASQSVTAHLIKLVDDGTVYAKAGADRRRAGA